MWYIVFGMNLSKKSPRVLSNAEINHECKLRLVRLAGKLRALHPDPLPRSSSLHLSSVSVLPPSSFSAFSPAKEIYPFLPGPNVLKRLCCVSLKKKKAKIPSFNRVNPKNERNNGHRNNKPNRKVSMLPANPYQTELTPV